MVINIYTKIEYRTIGCFITSKSYCIITIRNEFLYILAWDIVYDGNIVLYCPIEYREQFSLYHKLNFHDKLLKKKGN